jgi:hypothetical protein
MIEYQKIKSKIEKLDKNEIIEVFRIIHQNENKYTTNKNGVFVNLNICSEKTLNEIINFIDFIDESKQHLNDVEDKMNEKKNNLINNNNMFSQSISMNINHNENGNEKTRFISSDYSPFVTDDNYIIDNTISVEYSENDNITDINTENIVDFNDEIDDAVIDEENGLSEDYISNSLMNSAKKKKIMGIKSRIVKRCKNINGILNDNTEDIDKDIEDNIKNIELTIEEEYINI